MSEMLARGKRTDNGEWVVGFYVHLKDVMRDLESHRIYIYFSETDCGDFYPCWFEVDPTTVGRCTGIPDKNGVEIFEGDICEMEIIKGYPDPSPFLISIKNACVGFEPMLPGRCHPDDRKWRAFWNSEVEDMWDPDYFTVIGNIHDNPELMEENNA